jgi:HEAT repeat protein
MTGFRSTCLLAWAAVFAASGCRLFDAGAFGDLDRLDSPALAALRSQLGKDAWRRNPEWSLIRGTEAAAALHELSERPRWNFDAPLATALLDRLDNADRRVESRQSPLVKPSRTADAYLLEIAREDSLAGWNAAILLARRCPEAALPCRDRLRELTANPAHYDPETGRRAQPRSRPRTAAKREDGKPGAEGNNGSSAAALKGQSLAQLIDLAHDEHPPAARTPTAWDELLALLHPEKRDSNATQQPRTGTLVVSTALRCAAAEAWCRLLAAGGGDPIDGLAPAGRVVQDPKLPATVRKELTVGIAWHVPPAMIPGVAEALGKSRKNSGARKEIESIDSIRRMAVEACVVHAVARRTSSIDLSDVHRRVPLRKASESRLNGGWPIEIHARRDDPDPEIRILYGRWAALAEIDDALSILDLQSRLSIDKPVRRAAVVSLGLLRTDDARRLLRDVAKTGSAAMRVAAVKALSQRGARELAPFLEDESPGVRQAVAESLRTGFQPESATLAERLLKDKSFAVLGVCLDAIAKWPDRQAIPLLLQAMRNAPPAVASRAWQILRERRPELSGYTTRGDECERSEAVDRLVARFALPTARPWPSLAEISALPAAERQRLRNAVQRDVAVLVRTQGFPKTLGSATDRYRDAVDRLAGLGKDAVPYIESEIARSLGSWPRGVYRTLLADVLPKLHPAYSALRELGRSDPRVRWVAVQKLADLGQQSSLSPLVVKTLHDRISDWRSRAVWQAAMQAVMKDAHPEADALAIAASQIPSPFVQSLACEYFRRHPRTDFAGRILELMNSRHKNVRLAAIEAAGYCHQQRLIDGTPAETWRKLPASVPRDQRPKLAASAAAARFGLKHWTRAADREVADAAVMSLARLGDEFGYRQLHLMSHAGDPKRRRKVYEMMGKTGRAQFLGRLIERGMDEKSGELKKAILQSLNELTLPNDRPVGLSRISGYHEQIGAWHEWLNRRRGGPESRRSESRKSEGRT